MSRKIVWMFSGQGSQYFNMGRDLHESDRVFREWLGRCDEHYRARTNSSLLNVIYPARESGAGAEFDDLRQTHPALFCIQYSLAQTLLQRGLKPDCLLGYSLGEVVAAAVAGVMPFERLLAVVLEQAERLPALVGPGAMLAVLAPADVVSGDAPMFAGTSIAARNFSNHFVLAGPPAAIERVQRHFQSREISSQRLPVPVAFHSPCMDPAERPLREYVRDFELRVPSIPLVSASCVETLTRLTPDFFWDVVRRPVRFDETVAFLEARGPCLYVDLGPSGTLATFLKYALPQGSRSSFYPILSPYRRASENLERLTRALVGA